MITLCIQILVSSLPPSFKHCSSLVSCSASHISFSSHHLCSFCPHHPSIVVLQSLGLPFLLVISVKSFPFNCHFWNSPPLGDFFFTPVSLLLSGKISFISAIWSALHLKEQSQFSLPQSLLKEQVQTMTFHALLLGQSLSQTPGCFYSPCTLILSREYFSLLPLADSTDVHLPPLWLFNLPVSRAHNHSFTDIIWLNVYEKVIVTIT